MYKFHLEKLEYFKPDDLVNQILSSGPTSFINTRKKIDAIVGDDISIKIFDHTYERVLDQKSDMDIIKSLKLKFPKYFNETT